MDAKPDPDSRLSVTFWGVRGSIPTPGPSTLRYGGETTSMEIFAGPHHLLIDCGSGARALGSSLVSRNLARLDLLFTHTHLDHVCGLPFFYPAYDPKIALNLWAGHVPPGGSLEEIVARLMSPPIFPVPTAALRNTTFNSFRSGEPIEVRPGFVVQTVALHHPGDCSGFRIDWQGSSIAIITDHEHGDAAKDAAVAAFTERCDVMVYDSMYTGAEYVRHVGWGHSTPDKAIELAEAGGIACPVLFHHDPNRADDDLDRLHDEVRRRCPRVEVARQGMTVTVDRGRVTVEPGPAAPMLAKTYA